MFDTEASQADENSPTMTPLLIDHEVDISGDVYLLEIGEHPGLCLVSVPLTLKNYLSWNRDVVTSLEAKGN